MGAHTQAKEIERLERAFWDSMVQGRPDVATGLLTEPAMMVSGHGVHRFDHAAYTKMAQDDTHKLVGYTLSEFDVLFPRDDVAIAHYRVSQTVESAGKKMTMAVVDSSTWLREGNAWKCVAHTESVSPPA